MEKQKVLRKIASNEIMSGVVWIIVGCIQIILCIDYELDFFWCAGCNILAGLSRIISSYNINKRIDGLVEEYDKMLISIIIIILLNILIGGIIGVIGGIFDLANRSYVLNNRDIINGVDRRNNKYENLEKLQKLKESGILTEEEFNIEKKKILNQ